MTFHDHQQERRHSGRFFASSSRRSERSKNLLHSMERKKFRRQKARDSEDTVISNASSKKSEKAESSAHRVYSRRNTTIQSTSRPQSDQTSPREKPMNRANLELEEHKRKIEHAAHWLRQARSQAQVACGLDGDRYRPNSFHWMDRESEAFRTVANMMGVANRLTDKTQGDRDVLFFWSQLRRCMRYLRNEVKHPCLITQPDPRAGSTMIDRHATLARSEAPPWRSDLALDDLMKASKRASMRRETNAKSIITSDPVMVSRMTVKDFIENVFNKIMDVLKQPHLTDLENECPHTLQLQNVLSYNKLIFLAKNLKGDDEERKEPMQRLRFIGGKKSPWDDNIYVCQAVLILVPFEQLTSDVSDLIQKRFQLTMNRMLEVDRLVRKSFGSEHYEYSRWQTVLKAQHHWAVARTALQKDLDQIRDVLIEIREKQFESMANFKSSKIINPELREVFATLRDDAQKWNAAPIGSEKRLNYAEQLELALQMMHGLMRTKWRAFSRYLDVPLMNSFKVNVARPSISEHNGHYTLSDFHHQSAFHVSPEEFVGSLATGLLNLEINHVYEWYMPALWSFDAENEINRFS